MTNRGGLVSILIPTRDRPDMLVDCVRAAREQTYSPTEIIVSDDSRTDASEQALVAAGLRDAIRYVRNPTPLGQAGNVNQLLSLALGTRAVLIHDDDWLADGAIEDMDRVWGPSTAVVFGQQLVADHDGTLDLARSADLNAQYHRVKIGDGPQASQFSALVGQMPNDGYLVDLEAARGVGYRDDAVVSHCCDLDFSLRLALRPGEWHLISEHTSVYRVSNESVGRGAAADRYSDAAYRLLADYKVPPDLEQLRLTRLRAVAPSAILKWLVEGPRARAFRAVLAGHLDLRSAFAKYKLLLIGMLVMPRRVNRSLCNRYF